MEIEEEEILEGVERKGSSRGAGMEWGHYRKRTASKLRESTRSSMYNSKASMRSYVFPRQKSNTSLEEDPTASSDPEAGGDPAAGASALNIPVHKKGQHEEDIVEESGIEMVTVHSS